VLIGAMIVMAYFGNEASQRANELYRLAIDQKTLVLSQEIPGLGDFLADPYARSRVLRPRSDDPYPEAWGRVFLDGDQSKGLLIVQMPPVSLDTAFTLRVTDVDGVTHELASFDWRERISGIDLTLAGIRLGTSSVWSVATVTGQVVLRSV
jgi:hypothetical protein